MDNADKKWWEINNAIERKSLLRKAFMTDELPWAAWIEPTDEDYDAEAIVVDSIKRNGNKVLDLRFINKNDYSKAIRTFEIASKNKNDFSLEDEEMANKIINKEVMILDALLDFGAKNTIKASSKTLEENVNTAIRIIEKKNLLPTCIFANPSTFKKYLSKIENIDEVCDKCEPEEKIRKNLYGYYFGANIFCHKNITENKIYFTPSQNDTGTIWVRQNITILSSNKHISQNKDNTEAMFEEIGVILNRPHNVVKIDVR